MFFFRIILYIFAYFSLDIQIFYRGKEEKGKEKKIKPSLLIIFGRLLFGTGLFFTFGAYGLFGKLIAIFYTIWGIVALFINDIKDRIFLLILGRFMRFIYLGFMFFTDIGLIAR